MQKIVQGRYRWVVGLVVAILASSAPAKPAKSAGSAKRKRPATRSGMPSPSISPTSRVISSTGAVSIVHVRWKLFLPSFSTQAIVGWEESVQSLDMLTITRSRTDGK